MSRRNENRPGYKKTKLGWLPFEWDLQSLRQLARKPVSNGIFKRPHEYGSGVLILNVLDTYRGIIVDCFSLERVQINNRELLNYKNEYGDIFFVRSSLKLEGIGNCCVYLDLKTESVFECHLIRFRPDLSRIEPLFAAYLCRSSIVRRQLMVFSQTTTMTTLPQKELEKCLLPLPQFEEQKKSPKSFPPGTPPSSRPVSSSKPKSAAKKPSCRNCSPGKNDCRVLQKQRTEILTVFLTCPPIGSARESEKLPWIVLNGIHNGIN